MFERVPVLVSAPVFVVPVPTAIGVIVAPELELPEVVAPLEFVIVVVVVVVVVSSVVCTAHPTSCATVNEMGTPLTEFV